LTDLQLGSRPYGPKASRS